MIDVRPAYQAKHPITNVRTNNDQAKEGIASIVVKVNITVAGANALT